MAGWLPVIFAHALTPPLSLVSGTSGAMPAPPAYAVLAAEDQKPHLRRSIRKRESGTPWELERDECPRHFCAAVHRRLAVFGSRTPTVRQNALEVLPDAVSLRPRFHSSIVPRGYVLGSPRLCHTTSASEDSLDVRLVGQVLRLLKSCDAGSDLSKDLSRLFADEMDEDVVLKVLHKQRSNWQVALLFFTWAAGLPTYEHVPGTYIEMLDILGRMKKVRLMRQLFDEIPEQRRGLVVTNRMFAVLLNRVCRGAPEPRTRILVKANTYQEGWA